MEGRLHQASAFVSLLIRPRGSPKSRSGRGGDGVLPSIRLGRAASLASERLTIWVYAAIQPCRFFRIPADGKGSARRAPFGGPGRPQSLLLIPKAMRLR
jgi:hypothetical protein